MNWIELDIYTTSEGIEPLTGSLLGMGINGFVIKDAADFEEKFKTGRLDEKLAVELIIMKYAGK